MANDLVFLGAALVDLYYWLPRHLDDHHPSIQAKLHYLLPGGKGLLQAAAASKLIATRQAPVIRSSGSNRAQKVFLIGRTGDDNYGEFLNDFLRTTSVDISNLRRHPRKSTGSVAVLYAENSTPRYIGYLAAAEDVPPDYVTSDSIDAFKEHGIITSTFDIPFSAIEAAFSQKKKGAFTILNPSPPRYEGPTQDKLADLLSQADFIISSPGDAEYLLGVEVDQFEEIARNYGKYSSANIIITDGFSKAVLFSQKNKILAVFEDSTRKVDPSNSNGSVDIFISAVAVAVSEGSTIQEAVAFALVTGALSTREPTAAYACPTREMVEITLTNSPPSLNEQPI